MPLSWSERLAEGRLVPHFQPIVSVENQSVVAYEALGRQDAGTEVRSLGPFFQATSRDSRWSVLRRDVDRALRRAALAEFATVDPSIKLFLNVTPRLMVEHLTFHPDELPWTLRVMDEVGIDPRRVVIELTEEAVGDQTSSLQRLVEVYRAHGCQIAVDDVGAEASNLDRVGYFEPDIIKIDATMLRRSLEDRSFRQVLRAMGSLADGLGAALLFEGVETEGELQQALGFGARYLQGWYFAKAAAGLVPRETFSAGLRPVLERFGEAQRTEANLVNLRLEAAIQTLNGLSLKFYARSDRVLLDLAPLARWSDFACRVFVTDRVGFQVSANYERVGERWVENLDGLGRCRSFRPYFVGVQGPSSAGWSVSAAYHDSNDHTLMRTFRRSLESGHLLFVDVPEIEKQA